MLPHFTHDYLRKRRHRKVKAKESGSEPRRPVPGPCSQALHCLVTDLKLVATGELSLGLGQSLEQKHVPQTSSELGLWVNRTDLHRDQEGVLGNKESGIQAWKPDSQVGGGQGEAQAELCSPLSSEVCSCRPAGEASKTACLAGQKLAGKAKSQDLAGVEDRRMKGELLVIPRAKLIANQVGILRGQKQFPVQMYFKVSRLIH